jgi:hypothetical protein
VEDRPARPSPDEIAPDIADLFADNGTTYLNGSYHPLAQPVAHAAPYAAIFAQASGLDTRKAAFAGPAIFAAGGGDSVGVRAEVGGGSVALGGRLLALAARVTALRRRVCPDKTACLLWSAALVAILLWMFGLL